MCWPHNNKVSYFDSALQLSKHITINLLSQILKQICIAQWHVTGIVLDVGDIKVLAPLSL